MIFYKYSPEIKPGLSLYFVHKDTTRISPIWESFTEITKIDQFPSSLMILPC